MSRKRPARPRPSKEKTPAEAGPTPQAPRRSRWVLRVGILLMAAGGVLAWALNHRSNNGLTIENKSGQTITKLVVIADGKETTFSQVHPGTSVFAPFGAKTADRDTTALAANTWALLAQTQCSQPLGAGPAPYFLEVAELARTAGSTGNGLYSIAAEFPGKWLHSRGRIGERRTAVILPNGEIRFQ
jgi:hypothetical protein